MIKSVSQRFSKMQKVWKANFALFLLLILAISMLPSYAGDPGVLNGGKCGAKIALVLDRSASIGVSEFNGNQDNVNAVKFGSGVLAVSLKGPNAFTDVYAFASDAQRINSGWLNLVDDNHVNLQNAAISQIPFKTGATNQSSGNLYPDGLAAGSEALTNWEAAIRLPLVSHANTAADPMPDAIIIFTDGEPTTNLTETNLAKANGGTYQGLNINNGGYPGVDGVDADDLSAGYNMAAYARALGVRVIPVAIGDYSGANLQNMQKLAGPETLYRSSNFGDLATLLQRAAADVCQPTGVDTRLAVSVQEKTGPGTYKKVSLPITLDGALTGSITSTGNDAAPWATRNFTAKGNWDLRQQLQLPAGYRPIAERCERDKWNGQAPFIAEVEDSVGVNAHILMRGQAPGGTTYCEYVIEKAPVTPTSTLRIIATDKNTGAVLPAKFDYANSPFAGPQFETVAGGSWSTKTAQPATPWGFNTSWVAGSTPGYNFDSVYCRTGDWASSSPLTGVQAGAGIGNSPGGYAPGTAVSCEYKFVRLPAGKAALSIVKKVNGQDAPITNPVAVRIGDKLTYTFEIKNIGEIPVNNIKLVDSVLTSKRSDALTDCTNALNGKTLAVNETFTCTGREITVPVDSPATLKNIAVANGTGVVEPGQSPSNPAEVSDDANIKIVKPVVSIDKKVNPEVLSADGQTVTYTITAKNTGDGSYEGTITDNLLGVNKTVSIAPNGGTVTITIVGKFNLAAKSITFLKSQNADLLSDKTISISSNSLTNTACIKEINLCDTAKVDVADLSITKTAVPTNLTVSQNGKYVIAVKNIGNVALTNVAIKDDSLKNLFAAANDGVNNNVKTSYALTDSGVSCDNGQDATLVVGETCTVEISYTMTPKLYQTIKGNATSNSVSFNNIAVATAVPVGYDSTITRQDDATITITATPSLTINKTVSEKVVSKAGDSVTYTITVKNNGTGDATNVTIYERGLDLNFGPFNIAAGAQVVVNITATFDGNNTLTFTRDGQTIATKQFTNGTFKNIACLAPTGADPCSPEVTVYKPGLKLDKSANASTYVIGDNVVYTFKLTNTGATALGNVKLDDTTIPSLFSAAGETGAPKSSFVAADFAGDTNNNGFLDISETWTASATFKMTQKLASYIESHDSNASLAGAQFKNVGIAKADVVTPGTNNVDTTKPVGPVQDDAEITVNLNPGLEVTKTVSKPVVVSGDTYTYTITVKNIGTSTLTNVNVKDDNVGFTTTIPTLAVGESKSFTIDAAVNGNTITFKYNGVQTSKTGTFDASGKFLNIACASTSTTTDCSPEVIVKTPKIALEKTVKGNATVHIGETITYQFVVTNVNEVPVKDLVITDETLKTLFGLSSVPTINIDNSKLGADGVLTQGEKSGLVEFTTGIVTSEIAAKFTNGAFKNIAVVNGKAVLPDGSTKPVDPAQDDATVNLELRGGWTFTKKANNVVARPGDTVTYTFTVKNTGETVLPSVTVSDTTIGKTVVIAGPIAIGASATGTTTYVIPANYTGTNFVNTATACVTGTADCKTDTEKVYVPKVQLDKSGPAVASPGDKVTYKFVVKNIGETDLTNIVIVDSTLSTLLGKEVKITVPGTLKPGQSSAVIEYEATIPTTFKEKSFKNIAIVTATPVNPETGQPEPNKPVTDDDDHTILITQWHSTKTADKTAVKPGETINYVITVFNDGDVNLTGVEVSDPTIKFPADGKPIKVDVPANSKVEIKASYVVPANYTGNAFKNVAVVCVPRTGQNADCENPSVEVPVVRIQIVKKADKVQALVGDQITFSFDVTNKSGIDLQNVRVVDTKVNFDQIIPSLKVGETRSVVATNKYTVTAADLAAEKLTNIVSACAKIPGRGESASSDCTPPPACTPGSTNCTPPTGKCIEKPDTVCDDDEITIPVVNPTISIVKTGDKTTAVVGDTVNYTFVVTNTSKVEIRNITVVDNVLGDLGTIEKLAPGASMTKTKAYVVPVGAPGTIRNVATACFAEPQVTNKCASDDHVLTVTAVGGITVTKPNVLPYTGSTTDIILKSVLWMMLLGSAIVLVTRRKPRKA